MMTFILYTAESPEFTLAQGMPFKVVMKCNWEPGTGTEYLLQIKIDGAAG